MEDKTELGPKLLDNELREHLSWTLYPETADDLEAVQRAIVLSACGHPEVTVTVAGRTAIAGCVVAVLGLEEFLERRMRAWAN
ncbi:MAG: hypothetical protein H0V07_13160 [Propionibacteriales bacterium]|nr:hypothetical protein [Propionibacteriales bacterium]